MQVTLTSGDILSYIFLSRDQNVLFAFDNLVIYLICKLGHDHMIPFPSSLVVLVPNLAGLGPKGQNVHIHIIF